MAVTTETHTTQRSGFLVNANSADWTGGEIVVPAGAAGERIMIAWIHILSATALVVTLGDVLTAGDVSAHTIGPFTLGNSGDKRLEFPNPLVLTVNLPLIADTTAADDMTILAGGWYG